MHLRVLTLLTLLAAVLTTAARADLEVKLARYGNTSSYRDVRDVLTAFLRNNTLSFPVNARSMGGDPTPAGTDFLYIEYRAGGRDFNDTVPDGKVFTFRGVPNVQPVRPFLNLSFLQPPTPLAVPLLIINRSKTNARIYGVDRFGQWVWTADLASGLTLALHAQVGQEWIATDESNRVVSRQRITRGDNALWVNEPGERAPASGYRGGQTQVRFENGRYFSLYLYSLDPQGRWTWIATLAPGSEYTAATEIGELWIATDTSNRVVRQVTVAPGMYRVKVN
jgi:hypothetical protein